MTPERWQKIKPILERSLAIPVVGRSEFLKDVCDDEEMLREVEAFLEFENVESTGLDSSALTIITDGSVAGSMIGANIGRYEIVSELGAGGMGSVYLAIRADGEFKQKVALKLIKSGIGSESILKRFYAERQILATLAHPNIAHLIDGGTTENGTP